MQKKVANNSLRLVFIVAFICISYLVWSTYNNMYNASRESQHIRKALDVLLKLENILVDVQTIESAQRGFIISGDVKFLQGYKKGLTAIGKDTPFFKSVPEVITPGDAASLNMMINQKISNAKYVISLRRIYGYDSAASFTGRGKGIELMNDLNFRVTSLGVNARSFLEEAIINRDKFSKRATWRFILMALLFPAILLLNYRRIVKDLRQLKRREEQLTFNASLINNISDPIITTDKNFKITNWNAHAAELYGFSEKEVVGKTMAVVLKTHSENATPESRLAEFNHKGYWKGELIHHHEDGHPLTVDATSSAIYNLSGEYTGSV
ncbi:MAG TPA: PAS domain S-box protein [Ferruginibacter sp.]|nr:PAS domain S-box protein [Ferruginibacter sp.]